jgi:hypothetical protein
MWGATHVGRDDNYATYTLLHQYGKVAPHVGRDRKVAQKSIRHANTIWCYAQMQL